MRKLDFIVKAFAYNEVYRNSANSRKRKGYPPFRNNNVHQQSRRCTGKNHNNQPQHIFRKYSLPKVLVRLILKKHTRIGEE